MTEAEDSKIVLMLAYLCVSQEAEASLVRKVQILDRFGLSAADMAKVCGVPAQSVHNARSLAKKTRK
jgi:DNA-directed RNA polymerase specialized sigma24 family protein